MPATKTLFDNTPVRSKFELPVEQCPSSARVVIVGGGIAGASIAYHFAKAGWSDVVVLEQNKLSSGTTWHSAGQIGQLRSSSALTRVNKTSAQLYSRLKEETGHDPGWVRCGGLQLASCNERLLQLRRNAALADVFGVEAEIISAERCLEYWPMLRTDDLVGAAHLPGDGRVLPGECTIALVIGAIAGGVRIIENISVTGLESKMERGGIKRITAVETDRGNIDCDWVVLAGNMWMRQIGLQLGVDIPVYPCEHHYVITKPVEGVTRNSPCTRDPDAGIYFRSLDDGALKLGAFKKRSKPWQIGDQVPNNFAFGLLEPDWPDFDEPFAAHMHRLYGISRNDVVKFVNGPEAFTPDNNFIIGQPAMTAGLFVAGGWNSAGIACAGGAGQYAVEWIENGGMTIDLTSVDIRRFIPFQNGRKYLKERVSEVLGLHYQMAWPGRQMETSRDIRSSSLLEIHRQNNACFGEVAGWERPLFFAPAGTEPVIKYSFVRQNWHDAVAEEVAACRNNVGILDQSTFAKFMLKGSGALELLQRICGANIDVEIGRAVYTGMFNESGTYEADLTVVRTGIEEFYIVTATRQQVKDLAWIAEHIDELNVTIEDVTEAINVISVMGPNSSSVLSLLEEQAFDDSLIPYGSVRDIGIDGTRIRAIRVSYIGEHGWELHVEREKAAAVYRRLAAIGESWDMKPIGTFAIDAMRIEKGFRAIGHELSAAETPLEAGLGWTIEWDKDFVGKSKLLEQKKSGLTKRLTCFVLQDKEVVLWGNEPILWGDNVVGYTTSACFGPTVGASIAMGYVSHPNRVKLRRSDLKSGEFYVVNNGKPRSAHASFKAPIEIQNQLAVQQ